MVTSFFDSSQTRHHSSLFSQKSVAQGATMVERRRISDNVAHERRVGDELATSLINSSLVLIIGIQSVVNEKRRSDELRLFSFV